MSNRSDNLAYSVEQVVTHVLRPLIEADGGTIETLYVSDDRIVLRLGDACSGCPGVLYTKQHLIEPVLREAVGEEIRIEVQSNRTSQY